MKRVRLVSAPPVVGDVSRIGYACLTHGSHGSDSRGQYIAAHGNGLTARYVTSETFMNDFINSLRDKRIEGFKHRYRNYDLLLVDDVQFFEGKERI
jgi:chromosomal replication initiator protein